MLAQVAERSGRCLIPGNILQILRSTTLLRNNVEPNGFYPAAGLVTSVRVGTLETTV